MAKKTKMRFAFPTRRRLIQVYAALLANAHAKGFIKGDIYTGTLKNLCVPGLNCYSCPGAIGACPLGALQNALASSDKRAPYFMFGILMLMGLIAGRTICGYLCPFGLIQDLLDKVHVPKLKKSKITRALSYLKYLILAIFVIYIPLYYAAQSLPVPAFCKYICPAGTLEGALGLLLNPVNEDKLSMLNILFTRKMIILVVVICACMFIYRAFCRFLCPLGAIYGLLSRISLLGVSVDSDSCVNCGKCVAHCRMDIKNVSDRECIQCGECIPACPKQAISYKLTKQKPEDISINEQAIRKETEKEIEKNKVKFKNIFCWAIALAVLVLVFRYVNKSDKIADPGTTNTAAGTSSVTGESVSDFVINQDDIINSDNDGASGNATNSANAASSFGTDVTEVYELPAEILALPFGKEVGERCPDFDARLYGSDDYFKLQNCLGKVTIINFWATWCTPCCAELPYFDKLYREYGDAVNIVAIHSELVTDDVEQYLSKYDYTIPFALDETGNIITNLGGSTMLPMTVVLDQNGVILYNRVGSVTYEKLLEIAGLK